MAYIPRDAKWYLADLVVQMRIEGEPRSVVHINTILIRADSPEQAYDEAMRLGREHESVFENTDGNAVRTIFRGLSDLNVIHDELEHGAELIFAEKVGLSEQEIDAMVSDAAHLGVFQERRPSSGPNYMPREVWEKLRDAGAEGVDR